jgi:hypothetical protein
MTNHQLPINNRQSTMNNCKDGGYLMNNVDFQKDFGSERNYFNQVFAKARSIKQFKDFACACETLKLHALAVYIFRQLMTLDPKNRKQYFGHLIYNLREAEGKSVSLLSSKAGN